MRSAIAQLEQQQQHHMEDYDNIEEKAPEAEESSDEEIKYNIREGKKYFKEIKKVIESCDILI